ncbi:Gfo/Idh/MocA family oxidoreductase [Aurantibacter crassamenti]|uniref:Gfo/Idh/MocA family protein n=1 Tax=Aurantibacter crassamenti TaxID=1837375 RepID=UPI00193A690A|nr:Gfo/Idh/MocA family oxidoreductase [Aurantibacter crassamenti]MBM1104622.1 Gfo/Idh/MocA family oxidoreductase [Aurantibacter crassamenti]
MAKIGIGIIGTGSIVNTYVKCIEEIENAELIALYTKSSSRVAAVEKHFGVPVFDDIDKLLALSEIQLICVCNESGNHGSAILKAAAAGKHILSEKPLEVTPEKIDEVIESCKKHNVILGCVLQNRCSKDYMLAEKTIKEGKLGKLLMGNAHINWYRNKEYYATNPWRGTKRIDGGAAFMNQGIHTIDLLLNLMGGVKSVFGNVKTMVHSIEGEDVGIGVLNFESGAIGTITGGTALYPGYSERLEIYGEKGSILLEGGSIIQWNVQDSDKPVSIAAVSDGSGASDPTSIGHQNHKTVIQDMIGAINENRKPLVDGAEAKKAVEVITAFYRSSEEEKLIKI